MAGQAEKVFVPTDDELLQAQSDLWRHSLCYLTPMSLRCAVDLGVPTAIHRLGGAASPSELVAALSLPAPKLPFLARLLRQLATAGVFTSTDAGTYRLNPLSYLLVDGVRIDGDASQTAIVRAAASRYYVEAAMGLADWFRKDFDGPVPSPFEDVHGAAIFEESMALLDPEMDQLIHDAVAAHDHMGIGPVLRQCGELFEGLETLTDCGGGDGTTARSIVEAYPHIKCTVLDLPKVMDKVLLPAQEEGAVKYVSGDLFHVVPPAQAVLLKLVLHFWSDEDCIKILAQCKKAVPPRDAGGKVIVIDIVLGSVSTGPMLETQHLMDMLMLVMTRGRQREEKDWSEIFTKAGFSGYKIVKKLGARAVIEVYP
ncbi:putative O-methyltransferase 2 [Triticum urartu]|uniref:Putative O-methyltransferase 2 n=1 Tax=Triticum urartu TaxID=4572 RepID=M8APH1_TRIUA|nr:putative O-methyltransferase 2 [Triticum urartu]